MSRQLKVSLLAAIAAISLSAPLSAQARSTIDLGALDGAVAARPVNNRAIVSSALTSSNALATAASMGLSRTALETRIAALDDASAQQLADRILTGGDSRIVISTTAIIIGLLLLILLTR